jgi:hypothetical protein
MLAEASLQISHSYGLHGHMIVTTGHGGNFRRARPRVRQRFSAQCCPLTDMSARLDRFFGL